MAVSKFHRQVGLILEIHLGATHRIQGWPNKEVNLAKLIGMKGKVSFADYYLTNNLNDKSFVIEVNSTLHDERGIGAWGTTLDDHYLRMGNDDFKHQICTKLGIPLIQLWPEMTEDEILSKIREGVQEEQLPHIKTPLDKINERTGFDKVDLKWQSQSFPGFYKKKPFASKTFGKGKSFGSK